MKKIIAIFILSIAAGTHLFAQNIGSKPKRVPTSVRSENHLSSSILLWMRTDKPRQEGMDRWKGPHSKIISANKGLYEYRQIHLAENNTGLWMPIAGVETAIPQDRKIDGIADVTLKNLFSIFKGKKQNKLAYKDEVNIFKRTLLYAAFPKKSRWYNLSEPSQKIEARSIVFFRIKEGVRKNDFKKFIMDELTPTLANTGVLKELRSKSYNPWKQKQWNTPNVLHDNPKEMQFQASLMLGFTDKKSMEDFFKSDAVKNLSNRISMFCSAVHAYEILETLTYVKDGEILPHYQK
jgi:hypothetical protein